MTSDALDALARAGITRRRFLEQSGVLLVGFSAAGAARPLEGASGVATAQASDVDAARLDSWLAVAADGTVTAYTGKCELGQGMLTAQTQLVAEELDVPVDRVRLVQCETSVTPDQGTTSGSQSHPANFNQQNLALAAATAREMLLVLAVARLGTPAAQLSVKDGLVAVTADPSRSVGYGALVDGRTLEIPLSSTATRKRPADWTVLGTAVPRVDLPALVTGRFEFVHNVRVPGMLHGRVIRPPAVGASLVDVDQRTVRQLPGVVDVVVRNDFVGVVAEKEWQAVRAAEAVAVTWTPGTRLPDHGSFFQHLRSQRPTRDTLAVDSGDAEATLAAATTVVEATYLHPFQMHGSLGTSCAVADVRGDRATVWSPTQAVYALRSTTALLLGLPVRDVRVVFRRGSGCYGINGADTVSYDAALLSQAVGRPVRVQLTREDEMAWENYGYAFVIDQRVGVDAGGSIIAWDCEAWYPRLGGRPGYRTPGNVVTGRLAGFAPAAFESRTPAPEPSGAFSNRSNLVPSYVAGCVDGRCGGTGAVRSERVLSHAVESPFFTGPLRSPTRLQNTFAHECLMDEVAARTSADPVEYRLRHLTDPRLIEVVTTAAKVANWQPRPSPRRTAPTGVASGRGIACVLYEGYNGYVALVAEVDVDQDTGTIKTTRLVAAQDCGPISNPDGLRNQLEGGALQGLSRALGEQVTWNDRRVTSVDWDSYRSLPLGFDVPAIESVLIDRADGEALGAGETTITVVAAAVGNAIFDATGARLRQIPFTPARVKAALDARV